VRSLQLTQVINSHVLGLTAFASVDQIGCQLMTVYDLICLRASTVTDREIESAAPVTNDQMLRTAQNNLQTLHHD
jgi:hypothetical protein